MTFSGHDHLLDHWVERYTDGGVDYRRDDVVTGGGGAPIYTYRGEPEVQQYLAAGAKQNARLSHLMKPGMTPAENPHHFVVVHVDGDRSLTEPFLRARSVIARRGIHDDILLGATPGGQP